MKRFLFFLFALCVFGGLSTGMVFAASDFGLRDTADAAGLSGYGSNLPDLVGRVIGTALSMISVLFFILTVYGGVLWMTARGNEEQSKKALNTIIAASIGLVIILSSYALTTFVFNSVSTGAGGTEGTGTTGGTTGGTVQAAPAICQCAVEYSAFDNVNLDADGNEDVCIVTREPSRCSALCAQNPTLVNAERLADDEADASIVVEEVIRFSSGEESRALAEAQTICGPYVEDAL